MNTNGSAVATNPSSPIRRSTRKRTRQQYAEQQSEDSSVSPIQSRKRRRGRNHKLDDSDEDFQPDNEGPESEDDVSSHYSPSPKQQRTKPRNIMNRRVSTSSNDAE